MTNIDFGDNTSVSFKFKQKIRNKLSNVSSKKVEIIVPSKSLITFGELLKCH